MLEERGLSQAELARRLDRPVKTINEIVKGKAMIMPETALQLERALGAPAGFWLARESAYREWLARDRANDDLERWTEWPKELPLKEMVLCRWIGRPATKADAVEHCLRFFGVATVEAWRETYERPLAAFRASTKIKSRSGAVAAWLRQGEIEAGRVECNPFDARALEAALPQLRSLTRESDPAKFEPSLARACRDCGIAVVFVPGPAGCTASGAARWLSTDKTLVQLSVRYKTNDQLWFTFFHEVGHVLKHGRNLVFVDELGSRESDRQEAEANEFARDLLIPAKWSTSLKSVDHTKAAVASLAERIGVAPGIVVGRMQREKILPWTHLNGLKESYEFSDC
jgi:HTH-type transcriptional regulator/antitoxin HigA